MKPFCGKKKQAYGRTGYIPYSALDPEAMPHKPIRLAVSRTLLPWPGEPASWPDSPLTIFHDYCNQTR
jgi:hypothetical protein